jgi:hypothetical protein
MVTVLLSLDSAGRSPENTFGNYVLPVSLLTILGLITWWLCAVAKRRAREEAKWESGTFPIDFAYNRDHLMEAYIAAAASFARAGDLKLLSKKRVFITNYLRREFRDVIYDFSDSYDHSLRHPVTLTSLAAWMNLHMPTAETKQKMVDFLWDLAWQEVSGKEHRVLKGFVNALGLDWTTMEQRIADRTKTKERPAAAPNEHKRFAGILGLPEAADKETIKRTYRKLVKLYHPDKFMQDPQRVREQATARFREVQEAYDFLMNRT